jgi:hypothetical protein
MKTLLEASIECAKVRINKLLDKNGSSTSTFKSGYNEGAKEAQRWIPIEEELPPEDGQDILLKNEKWINEDYNVNGVRIGCYGDGKWMSASWCNNHDEYHTRTSEIDDETFTDSLAVNQIPTHWRPIERR